MPPLLQSAQLKPDVTITSADSDNEIDESDDERSTLIFGVHFFLFCLSLFTLFFWSLLCIVCILVEGKIKGKKWKLSQIWSCLSDFFLVQTGMKIDST